MTDIINFEAPVEEINFEDTIDTTSKRREQYELDLQQKAGIEPTRDFKALRDQLAQQEIDKQREWDNKLVEFGLRQDTLDLRAAEQVINRTYIPDPDMALERAAAARMTEESILANPDQAEIVYADSDADTAEDETRKVMYYQRWLTDLKEYSDSQGALADTGDLAVTAIPIISAGSVAKESGYSESLLDKTYATHHGLAEGIRESLRYAMANMSSEEFKTYLNTVTNEIKAKNPNRFMLDDYIHAAEFGGSTVIDTANALEVLGLGGIIKSVSKAATKSFTKALLKKGSPLDKLKFLLGTAEKPVSQKLPDVTPAHIASNEVSEELINTVKKDIYTEGLEKEQEEVLKEAGIKNLDKVFGKAKNEPVDATINYLEEGNIEISYLLGDGAGRGYTDKTAKRLQKEFDEAGVDVALVKRDDSGTYLQFTQGVSQEDYNKIIPVANDPRDWIPGRHVPAIGKILEAPLAFLGRHFAGSTMGSNVSHAKDIAATRVYNALLNKYGIKYKSTYAKLDKAQKELLDDIAVQGNTSSVWYTDDYLRKSGCNEDAIKAYHDYREIEDINWIARNYTTRRELTRRGVKQYAGRYLGKETPLRDDTIARARIITENGEVISNKTVLLNKDNYRLIKLDPINSVDATHLVIAKSSELVESPIPFNLLPYKAGGRREYLSGTFFIRVAGDIKDAEGSVIGKRIRTIATANSAADGDKMAEEINAVIKLIDEVKDPAEGTKKLSELDLQFFKVNRWEDVEELIKGGVLSSKGQAQSMLDGKKFVFKETPDNIIEAEDWANDMHILNNSFNKKRGNVLDNVLGNKTTFYNIDEMFDKAIRKAAALGGRSDLMLWYKDTLKQYKSVIENWSEIEIMNPVSAIRNAKVMDNIGDKQLTSLARSAKNFVEHAKAIANARTAGQEFVKNAMDEIAYQALKREGKAFKTIGDWATTTDPVAVAQGLVFNKVMGWYNPKQLIQQALGTNAVLALEPKNASKALVALPVVMRGAITKDYKSVAKALDITIDDAKRLYEYMSKFGTKESAGLLTGAEQLQKKVLKGNATVDKILNHQYDFMRWGNAINYYVADITAFLTKKNQSFRDILEYSDDLFMNMTRSSNAGIQRGLTAPLTQWMTYPMRWLEVLGNKRLTKTQRLRFLASQVALYGVGGVTGETVGKYIYGWDDAETAEEKTFINEGLMGLISNEIGVDLRDGPRVFDMLGTLKENFTDIKNVASMAAGPYVVDTTKAAFEFMSLPFTDEQLIDWAYKQARTGKNLPSGMKAMTKAMIAFSLDKVMNYKGVSVQNPSMTQKILTSLGYNTNESYHARMLDLLSLDNNQAVKDFVGSMDDILYRIERYNLVDPTKAMQDENYARLIREYKDQYRLITTAMYSTYGDGSPIYKMFDKALIRRIYGTPIDLEDSLAKKAYKTLNNAQKALLFEILRGE